MNILRTILVTVAILISAIILLSMSVGKKDVKEKNARLGLSALSVCLIFDILTILGGVFLW